jgi:hypothetical protein
LFIGREELGFIAIEFGKMIICFETGTVFVTQKNKEDLQDMLHYSFPI